MAQKVQIFIECDLDSDGERRPAETVTFYSPTTGQQHELDACDDHRKDLEEAFAAVEDFTGLARRMGPRPGKAPARKSAGKAASNGTTATLDPKAVREWAKANGVDVNERGRLSASVIEAYQAAH